MKIRRIIKKRRRRAERLLDDMASAKGLCREDRATLRVFAGTLRRLKVRPRDRDAIKCTETALKTVGR